MNVPVHIFRQYDIRGLVGHELTPEIARAVGRAYGSMAEDQIGPSPRVVVGHDNRPSSPELVGALMEGLEASGAKVVGVPLRPYRTPGNDSLRDSVHAASVGNRIVEA